MHIPFVAAMITFYGKGLDRIVDYCSCDNINNETYDEPHRRNPAEREAENKSNCSNYGVNLMASLQEFIILRPPSTRLFDTPHKVVQVQRFTSNENPILEVVWVDDNDDLAIVIRQIS